MWRRKICYSLSLSIFLVSCKKEENGPEPKPEVAISEEPLGMLGGGTTVFETSRKAYTLSSRNLEDDLKSSFFLGNSLFNKNWIQAPGSAEARDGLGPLYIARSCSGCHIQDGRGRPPLEGEEFVSLLFRVSQKDELGRFHPHSVFGSQIQTRSLSDDVREPDILVEYEEVNGQFADGTSYTLQKPIYSLEGNEQVVLSPRVAPSVIGLGLLEAIPESQLVEWADPKDENGDGISGRMNVVIDFAAQGKVVGRFGWKANQPHLSQQVAAAFNGDLGITSSLFPKENSSSVQAERLLDFPSGGSPEISDRLLESVVTYCQTLAVPAQRKPENQRVKEGQELFRQLNCVACHQPNVITGEHPILSLSKQKIQPFSDLLLHDMGPDLADGRPDGNASGREWRTAPLWGIGLVETVNKHTRFLHDGRARTIQEAILWHGGEAEEAKNSFIQLDIDAREKLLEFISSL